MIKLIYLAKRKPGFTFDEFVRRWRMHGALGMSQPLWRFALAYVQAESIIPAPISGASEEYDAVACYMMQDAMFTSMTEEDFPGAMAMADDELETFSGPIAEVSLWVREEPIKPGALGGITAFLFFADQSAARDIAEQVRDAQELNRVTLNLRDDSRGGPQANTLPHAAVVELSACNVPSLEAAAGKLLAGADVTVVTREAVLWDRLP
mgnify:CR=1 FL=1